MADIINSVNSTLNIINQYEEAFTSGDYKGASLLFSSNFNYIVDTINQISACFASIDRTDESGYGAYWQDTLKNVTLAYRSKDMFLRDDILCCDLKSGIEQFMNIIGDE